MIKIISLPLFLSTFSFVSVAQEKVTVKKGTIYSNNIAVAEFDGKGSAMRRSNYKIKAVKSDSVLITVVEKEMGMLYNPLLVEQEQHLYDLTFASRPGETFVLDVHPYIVKSFGKIVVNYRSKWGTDLMEELFNDSVPLLIEDGKLKSQNVEKFIADVCYPYDKKMAEIKQLEDSIAIISKNNIARDVKKPVSLQKIANPEGNFVEWFNIIQDNVVIGQLRQLKGAGQIRADYEIWKKAPAGSALQSKVVDFVPVVMVPIRGGDAKQEYQAIKVAGKEKFMFKSANPMAAELDIINTMISMGLL